MSHDSIRVDHKHLYYQESSTLSPILLLQTAHFFSVVILIWAFLAYAYWHSTFRRSISERCLAALVERLWWRVWLMTLFRKQTRPSSGPESANFQLSGILSKTSKGLSWGWIAYFFKKLLIVSSKIMHKKYPNLSSLFFVKRWLIRLRYHPVETYVLLK